MSLVPNPDYEDNPNPNVLCMGVIGAVAITTLYNAVMGGIFMGESALYVDIDSEELRQEIVQSDSCAPPADESLRYLGVGSAIEEKVLQVNNQIGCLYSEMRALDADEAMDVANIGVTPAYKSNTYFDATPEELSQEVLGLGNIPLFIDESMHYIQVADEAEKVVSDARNQVVYIYNDRNPVSVYDMLGQEEKPQQDVPSSGSSIKHCGSIADATFSVCVNPLNIGNNLSTKITLSRATDLSQKAEKWTEPLQMTPKSVVIVDHPLLLPAQDKRPQDRFCLQENIRSVIVDYKEHPDEHAELTIKTAFSLESCVWPKEENKVHPLLMDAEMLRARRRRGYEWFLG